MDGIIHRILQFLFILHLISSYQTSYVRSARSRLKEAVSQDLDAPALHKSLNELSSSRHDIRDFHVFDAKLSGQSRRWSHRRRLGATFTPWSRWSQCNIHCKQKRERYCKVYRKCGEMKHIEERRCYKETCSLFNLNHPITNENHHLDPYLHHHGNSNDDDRDYFIIKSKRKKPNKPRKPSIVIDDLDDHRFDFDSDDEKNRHQQDVSNDDEGDLDDINERLVVQIIKENSKNKQNDHHNPNRRATEDSESGQKKIPSGNIDKEMFDNINDGLIKSNNSKSMDDDIDDGYAEDVEQIENKQKFGLTLKQNSRHNHRKRRLMARGDDIWDEEDDDEDLQAIRNSHSNKNNSLLSRRMGSMNSSDEDEQTSDEDEDPLGLANRKQGREKAVIDIPSPRYRRVYTKWSKWSKCTAKCTTRRFKKCKITEICGNEVLREIAYCYTEGSFCEEWIASQMHNPAPRPTMRTTTMAPYIDRRRDNGYQNSITNSYSYGKNYQPSEFTPQNIQCGIPAIRGKSRDYKLWNMLRIIGGKTARRGQWPWQVAILNRFKEAFCGGTLISPWWIVTAAHCVRKRLYVRLGEYNLEQKDGTEVEYRVEMAFKHPKYDKKTVDNDVAMLKLPKEMIPSANIGFACLPQRYQQLPAETQCTIIGWGKRRNTDDAGTNILHEAEVPIITNEECKSVYYDYTITKNMFCAGHKRGRIDTCAGDSGGPLLCRDGTKANKPWTIFGITSFGDGCGKRNKFGIYAKLPNYVDWIWSVVNCNGHCRKFRSEDTQNSKWNSY